MDCLAFFVFNFSPTALNFPLLNFAFKVREMRRVAQSPAGSVVVTVVTALAVILHRSGSTEPSLANENTEFLPNGRKRRPCRDDGDGEFDRFFLSVGSLTRRDIQMLRFPERRIS